MFGIGMQEIVLICAIALIVVGPKKLPEFARALGKGYGEFRRAFDEMKRNVESDFHADEIRRGLLDLPPRPQPPGPQPEPEPESLLTTPPAAARDPFPYPETLDASPPPPEPPDPAPGATAAQPDGSPRG